MVPDAAKAHYRRMQALQVVTLAAAARAWGRIEPDHLRESWVESMTELEPVVESAQVRAAAFGASYGALTLVQSSGEYRPPAQFVNPRAFAGITSGKLPMRPALASPIFTTLSRISEGVPVADALKSGKAVLDRVVRTSVADAGRLAAGVDAASRAGVGYIRMLNPPSCSRCVVMAGRRYRWNQGFLRHPGCDCVHVQATAKMLSGAEAEGLLFDQHAYFESLTEAEQDRIFTRAGAQAIRDGADMNRVVNARRGMTMPGQHKTVELTGNKRRAVAFPNGRLSPEGIYARAGSREEALRLLEESGYFINRGPLLNPMAGKGWDYEGFGQMGRGGTRRGYRQAALESWRTGVQNDATLTAAQRRVETARLRYEAAMQGRNPYGKGPVEPWHLARAENDYRAQIYSGGEIFTE